MSAKKPFKRDRSVYFLSWTGNRGGAPSGARMRTCAGRAGPEYEPSASPFPLPRLASKSSGGCPPVFRVLACRSVMSVARNAARLLLSVLEEASPAVPFRRAQLCWPCGPTGWKIELFRQRNQWVSAADGPSKVELLEQAHVGPRCWLLLTRYPTMPLRDPVQIFAFLA